MSLELQQLFEFYAWLGFLGVALGWGLSLRKDRLQSRMEQLDTPCPCCKGSVPARAHQQRFKCRRCGLAFETKTPV